MAACSDIVAWCDQYLAAADFADYCPNGLQVEGRDEVRRLVSGVTASQAFLERALEAGADMVLVHHGYFWRGENAAVVGVKARRLRLLMAAGLNLLAYHLPLDCHEVLGNNRLLGDRLGIAVEGASTAGGVENLLWRGRLPKTQQPAGLAAHLQKVLQRAPIWVDGGCPIETVAWCTGGGQGFIEEAADLGVHAYISGEISEQTTHLARERGLSYFAAGHHATERYGVQALGAAIGEHFAIEHEFIEIDNPA